MYILVNQLPTPMAYGACALCMAQKVGNEVSLLAVHASTVEKRVKKTTGITYSDTIMRSKNIFAIKIFYVSPNDYLHIII